MVSGVSIGFAGSKYTRLLKHGEAGQTVAIVEVSMIERPWGSSSRCMTVSTPPYFGVWAGRAVGVARATRVRISVAANRQGIMRGLLGTSMRGSEHAVAARVGPRSRRRAGTGGPRPGRARG